jgi:molecular chaperone GrpE
MDEIKDRDENQTTAPEETSGASGAVAGEPVQTDQESTLKAKLKEFEARNRELSDQLLRGAAEFDNYRKRMVRDQARMAEVAQESILKRLLGVVDNIERAVQHGRSATKVETLQEGNEALYTHCLTVLSEVGVSPMDALTKPFDHNLHEAISQQENAVHDDGTVLAVAEAGYVFKDRVLRHAKVVVSKKPAAAEVRQTVGPEAEGPQTL